MQKDAIGHTKCPECGFDDAEVKEDRSGKAYRYCPNCDAQYFSRSHHGADKRLRDSMRPVATPPAPGAAGPPKPVPAAGGKPKSKPFAIEDL